MRREHGHFALPREAVARPLNIKPTEFPPSPPPPSNILLNKVRGKQRGCPLPPRRILMICSFEQLFGADSFAGKILWRIIIRFCNKILPFLTLNPLISLHLSRVFVKFHNFSIPFIKFNIQNFQHYLYSLEEKKHISKICINYIKRVLKTCDNMIPDCKRLWHKYARA